MNSPQLHKQNNPNSTLFPQDKTNLSLNQLASFLDHFLPLQSPQLQSQNSSNINDSLSQDEHFNASLLANDLEMMLVSSELNLKTTQNVFDADTEFLNSTTEVLNEIDNIEKSLSLSENHITQLLNKISMIKQQTISISENASILVDEKYELVRRYHLAIQLNQKLGLSPQEWQIINPKKGTEIKVDDTFFSTLKKLKALVNDCGILLQTSNPIAATLGREAPEPKYLLKKAINELFDRPSLYETTIQNLIDCRSNALQRAFINALVRGGPNGVPRAIEVHASDPLRYVSDMLAWTHQSQENETEFLEQLLPIEKNTKSYEITEKNTIHSYFIDFKEILGGCLEDICKPLELRLNQTLSERESPVLLLQLHYLIGFYQDILGRKLSAESSICLALKKSYEGSYLLFQKTFDSFVEQEIENMLGISMTLDVSETTRRITSVCQELFYLKSSSPGSNNNNRKTNSEQNPTYNEISPSSKHILSGMLTTIKAVEDTATESDSLLLHEKSIYMWNTLYFIKAEMGLFGEASEFILLLDDKLLELQKAILGAMNEILVNRSCLKRCFDEMNDELPNISASETWNCFRAFDKALSEGSMDLSSVTSRIHDTAFAQNLRKQSVDAFLEMYTQLHILLSKKIISSNKISDQNNDLITEVWEVPDDLIVHHPGSVNVLF
ncbi:hypothetical protein BB558_005286 [Smittium angustum]|uniref:Conserved Oligomeric Golgi complex subunit 6 C-terminal domain-containing protein n=1 Tax=Smittium angustum TaxID=133377 RepID=A0A2U1J0X0_SMIAN|nr:hypothetical protein BB558_005286 [Smittium angustum]